MSHVHQSPGSKQSSPSRESKAVGQSGRSAGNSVDFQVGFDGQPARDQAMHLTSNDVLSLQRSMGNQAVSRLLGQNRLMNSAAPAKGAVPLIQPKLQVGPVNDVYER